VVPLYPLIFQPRFKERVWGGRRLETLYGKTLPAGVPIGESWEISDRPDDESVIANGPLAGRTLRDLMSTRAADVLGDIAPTPDGRFPLLCKILDARQKLSLQVHPPDRATHLGEPKTEMWYIADAESDAQLFVGLKRGVTRAGFEDALRTGQVADCFHRIHVRRGDAMFLPSGRVHGIGSGLVIFEIQQSSDTTFRVYDWDRTGLDGKPRELHVPQSLASIDFADFEPNLIAGTMRHRDGFATRALVDDALFRTDLVLASRVGEWRPGAARLRVLACVKGSLAAQGEGVATTLRAGDFCLLPARMSDASIVAAANSEFLVTEPGPH
jgi:mannose-6-phosphate isomerase